MLAGSGNRDADDDNGQVEIGNSMGKSWRGGTPCRQGPLAQNVLTPVGVH
jgi:hypothetical protein